MTDSPTTRQLSCSSRRRLTYKTNTLTPFYDDAVDVGLVIQSAKTGKLVRYFLLNVTKDGDGDVEAWNYSPTTESIREVPECQGTSVTVFND